MAKISASDGSSSWGSLFAKHHFWMLSVLVPLILLPVLFLARGQLTAEINSQREKIKGHLTALQSVRRIPQHPNDSWSKDIDTSTMRVKKETFAEWRKLWDSQQSLRVWPESLGADFVKAAESLKSDGKLSRKLLERYQNNVRMLVRELPKRMGVSDGMADVLEPGQSQPALRPEPMRPRVGAAEGPVDEMEHLTAWDPANQTKIFLSFNWDKVPSTTRVLLAQEELWVYGLLCDAVARINKPATGLHNAAIASVDELYVGYPAAEDNPGGVAGGRVVRVKSSPSVAVDAVPDSAMPGPEGAAVGRPPNPRFGGDQRGGAPGGPPAPGDEGGGQAVDPDDLLRNWVYVDFTGKPMDAAQLATAVDSPMVHLMPFVLRVVIDERQIDALLVDLAKSSIPVDVRQVRINASTGKASGQPAAPAGADPGNAMPGSTGTGRLHDVNLELRGTIGLATKPNEKTVGLETGEAEEAAPAEAGGKPTPTPKAAVLDGPARRRITS